MKFLIAAGHGAGDPGNMAAGLSEAALMLELRDIVALKLRALGHDVITDGAKGENWALARAIKLITGRVAIELHTNASSSPTARGVEVISLPSDKALAKRIARNIARTLNTVTRREAGWLDPLEVKRDRGFYPGFVRNGGLIVETFFQSNPNELANYHGSSWLVAQAIVAALTIKV